MRTLVMMFCAAAVGGCLQVDVDSGVLQCSSVPDRRCPEGYFCAGDNKCWKNGSMVPGLSHRGQPCELDAQCDTGHCVDVVCCDSACTGQCQACDAVRGTCTTITGTPHGTRPRCPTAGLEPCAAVCTGNDPFMCAFPSSSTLCTASTCIAPPPTLKLPTVCDGAGHCVSPGGMVTTPCPAPPNGSAICSGTRCDFVCIPPYQRVGSMCVLPANGDMG